jgi:predicted transcriptional regulator
MKSPAQDAIDPQEPLFDEGALELDVRDVMTAAVVAIPDDSTLDEAVDAMAAHRIHAGLVVELRSGTPLGWVTTRGLLGLLGVDGRTRVTEAITEEPKTIEPTASVRAAIYALSFPGVTRLLVRPQEGTEPGGVVTDYDLTVRATRRAGFSRRPG